jgi:hypothetical protein
MLINVELVPSTSFGNNLRSRFKKGDWDALRKFCYRQADYKCQLCGEAGPNHPVEAHEVWECDPTTGFQKIVDLLALCPCCHLAHHTGFARTQGHYSEAMSKLMKINNWSQREADDHITRAGVIWDARNQQEWTLNLNLYTKQ